VLCQALAKPGGASGSRGGAAGAGASAANHSDGSTAVWQALAGFRLFEGVQ
jgi:hypothetical protein